MESFKNYNEWSENIIFYMDLTMFAITLTWFNFTRTLFEILFTMSANEVRNHFNDATTESTNGSNFVVTVQKRVEVQNNFGTCFGPILTLHILCYTLELMGDTFAIILWWSFGDQFLAVFFIFLPSIISSLVKIFNIVGQCSSLTDQINIYIEYLDDYHEKIPKKSPERGVSEMFFDF